MKTSKKIPKTFISFLVASFLIWLLITFSKEYETLLTFKISYKNIPQDKLLQETPVEKINMSVKASGFKILRSKFRNQTLAIEASSLQRKKGSKYYLLPKNQQYKIQRQLISGIVLQEINIDTLYLNLGSLASKKVALNPDINIKFHVGYDLLEPIKVQPDSVIISGPDSQISKLQSLNLQELSLEDVKSDFSVELPIVRPKNSNILKLNTPKAIISGKVDKFTEGSLQLPFIIKNLPENVKLNTLENKVKVIFIVALSNFSKVSESSFVVECDYSVSEKNKLDYLIPKVSTNQGFIKSVKVVPSKIDFLIQK